jgi:hypothetical protein
MAAHPARSGNVDLARVLIANSRDADPRREPQRVIDERTPSRVADWTVEDLPRARKRLESIRRT